LRQRADPTTLREYRLQHREHRLRGLGRGGITNKVCKLFTASVDGAHVAAKIVHEDFRRIRTTIFLLAFIDIVIALVFKVAPEHIKEALHDADVVGFRSFHTVVLHDNPLEKSAATAATATVRYCILH
jgi:hypothetical protein